MSFLFRNPNKNPNPNIIFFFNSFSDTKERNRVIIKDKDLTINLRIQNPNFFHKKTLNQNIKSLVNEFSEEKSKNKEKINVSTSPKNLFTNENLISNQVEPYNYKLNTNSNNISKSLGLNSKHRKSGSIQKEESFSKKTKKKVLDFHLIDMGEEKKESFNYSVKNIDNQRRASFNSFVNDETICDFKILYFNCVLCGRKLLKEKVYSCECSHYFCEKCGRSYYETKIEQGFHLKCMKYYCNKKLNEETLKKIVHPAHFEAYKIKNSMIKKVKGELESSDDEDSQIVIDLDLKRDKNNIKKQIKSATTKEISSLEIFNKKSIYKINNSNLFIHVTKPKEVFCKKCYAPALCMNYNCFIKCMNCFDLICKYCGEQCYDGHYDQIGEFKYCKIYFEKKLKNIKVKDNKCRIYFFAFLLILVGYCFLICGILNEISLSLKKLVSYNKNSILKKIVYYFFFVIAIIIIFFIALALLPFYPAVMAIVR